MTSKTTTFTGEAGVTTFVALSLKSGIKLYAKTGIRPNRAWTPRAMMAKASEITGKKLKPRDYDGAVKALEEWVSNNGTTGEPR